jgi:hypothetical protein
MARPAYQTVGWNNRIRPVSSIEEVKAASIDFDGSVFYFSDLANKRIYTKQINLDGTAQLNMYELKETPVMEQPIVDTSNFITRTEFDHVISYLKNFLMTSNNTKQDSVATDKEPVNQETTPTTEARSFDF